MALKGDFDNIRKLIKASFTIAKGLNPYEKPICDCSGELLFVDGICNRKLQHEVRRITKSGYLSIKIIEERPLDNSIPIQGFLECRNCGSKWDVGYDDKGRIL